MSFQLVACLCRSVRGCAYHSRSNILTVISYSVAHGRPSEGASNIALALFTFPSLAAYETYRTKSFADPECLAAFEFAKKTNCIVSYERSFLRPVFD
jgi:hypothetical protein